MRKLRNPTNKKWINKLNYNSKIINQDLSKLKIKKTNKLKG